MNAAHELEGRYRRLLALYPAEHRAEHEEEMLGVLMTAAPAGQRRPRLAESAALIRGAVRIWLRPGRGSAFQRWQDGLAAVSVLLPLLLTIYWAIGQVDLVVTSPNPQLVHALSYSAARTTGPWLIVAVLVLFRLRWPAVVVGAGRLSRPRSALRPRSTWTSSARRPCSTRSVPGWRSRPWWPRPGRGGDG
jgi:hypothetical protein